MNVPRPRPIASRKNTGSKKPDSTIDPVGALGRLEPARDHGPRVARVQRADRGLVAWVRSWSGGHPAAASARTRAARAPSPPTASTTRTARCQPTGQAPGRRAVGERPADLARVPQRRDPADPLQPDRQRGEREERAGEQEHRREDEPLDQRRTAPCPRSGSRRTPSAAARTPARRARPTSGMSAPVTRVADRAERQRSSSVVDGAGEDHPQHDREHQPAGDLLAARPGRRSCPRRSGAT